MPTALSSFLLIHQSILDTTKQLHEVPMNTTNKDSTIINENSSDFGWVTIDGFLKFTNHQITENQIRWCLRSKNHNGLDQHITTFGRKIYVHKQGFLGWFEENNK